MVSLVPESFSFPAEEERILKYWKEIDAFKTSYKKSKDQNRPKYTFYDGPPFATGLPHYGHILAGTIKVIFLLHIMHGFYRSCMYVMPGKCTRKNNYIGCSH